MKRRVAAFLASALMALGQQTTAVATAQLVVDGVAIDATGRPVADLKPDEFEIVQGGQPRKVTQLTWYDTKMHVAISRAGQLPAIDLLPDQIRRNLVVVVDDLGLTTDGIDAARTALRAFVTESMASGDRMAILRTSGGSSVLQQLTSDSRTLTTAIDSIQYLGGSTTAANAGRACWLTLRYALDGLRNFDGRKVVVILARDPYGIGPSDRGTGDAARAAHEAGAAVYALALPSAGPDAASGAPSAMDAFVRDTGGALGGDFAGVLQTEQGYYAIGFPREAVPVDASGHFAPTTPAAIKVLRPGVSLRSRAGYITNSPSGEETTPEARALLAKAALDSPFTAPDIPVRLTALFAEYPAEGPVLEAAAHFDSRNFSIIHDLQDRYHGSVQVRVVAYTATGLSTRTMETSSAFNQLPAEYRRSIENGMTVSFRMKLPGPGAWQVRAVVLDGSSDRMGSATQFVDVPDVREHSMAVSGLTLSGDAEETNLKESAGVRIFKPGRGFNFRYNVFNAITGLDRRSAVQVQTRIFSAGHVVFDGTSARVDFENTLVGTGRQIVGKLTLTSDIGPGDYVLQVTVRDLLAPSGQPRTATQFTDFQVRD